MSPIGTDFHEMAGGFHFLFAIRGPRDWCEVTMKDQNESNGFHPTWGEKNIGKSLVDSTWISRFKVSPPVNSNKKEVWKMILLFNCKKPGNSDWITELYWNRASVRCDMQKTSQEVPRKSPAHDIYSGFYGANFDSLFKIGFPELQKMKE